MMEVGQLRDPFGARSAQERGPLITEGSYRNGKTEIYKKGTWEPVNVIHAGQRAMVNGKMRTADGKGNWYDPKDPGKYSHETGEYEHPTYGTYEQGNRRPSKKPAYTSNKETKFEDKGAGMPTFTSGLESNKITVGGKTYDMNNPADKQRMNADIDKSQATKKPETDLETPITNPERPGNPTEGDEISALTGGRGDERTNALGVVQKGTNTGVKAMTIGNANDLLAKYGITDNGFGEKFSSNQLPSTKGSPYGQSSSADNQVMGGSARDSAVIESGGSVETVIGGDTDLDNVKSTYSSGDRSARRRAFLDYDGPGGSMAALRAAEASDGVMYAGGKHHIANPNAGQEGQDDFMAISKDENYQIATGKQTAQGLRDQYVNKLKGNGSAQEITDASQNAAAMLPGAVPGQTPMDKSPFDTQELMQQKPGKSIIGNNTPYTSIKKGSIY